MRSKNDRMPKQFIGQLKLAFVRVYQRNVPWLGSAQIINLNFFATNNQSSFLFKTHGYDLCILYGILCVFLIASKVALTQYIISLLSYL